MKVKLYRYVTLVIVLMFSSGAFGSGEPKTVLFDQGHGQRFLIQEKGELQLSDFAEVIAAQGVQVKPLVQEITKESLSDAAAVVISGAFVPLKQSEIDALSSFIEQGGRLAVMLHIGQPVADLLHHFDVDISNMVLHEQQNIIDRNDINFQVRDLTAHPLFSDTPHFSLYGGWALNPGLNVQSIARTSNQAWVDLDGDKKLSKSDVIDTFSVAVTKNAGAGKVLFFGDDAIFQNRFLDKNNRILAANLGKWLINR